MKQSSTALTKHQLEVTTMTLTYEEIPAFKKDLKKLTKRFKSLPDDLKVAKKGAIELLYLHHINNQSIFPIPQLCNSEIDICKIKKFACKYLKGRGKKSGIRVIYAYFKSKQKVVFIQIYFKGNKENEDRNRIKQYLKSIKL